MSRTEVMKKVEVITCDACKQVVESAETCSICKQDFCHECGVQRKIFAGVNVTINKNTDIVAGPGEGRIIICCECAKKHIASSSISIGTMMRMITTGSAELIVELNDQTAQSVQE